MVSSLPACCQIDRFWKKIPAGWLAVLICAGILSAAWLTAALVIPLAPFGPHTLCTNDGYAQYMPFLSNFWEVFRNGTSPMYSFDGGLGSNFYLTIAYYLCSPFSFLALLFDRSQIPAAANLIIVVKNIAVAAVMAWYLTTLSSKPRPWLAACMGIAYGVSYYFLGYAVNFMWMDGIALVPVMLYGLARLDSNRGRLWYMVSLSAAIVSNFYMGAILCIFLALYYVVIHLHFSRTGLVNLTWFAGCSIVCALISAFILLPVVQGMLMDNASRMSPPQLEIFNDARYVLSRLLPNADVVRITHNRGAINLYMGSIVLFLLVVYILQKSDQPRKKWGLLGLCALYFAATQISWLNYAFHGFYLQRQVPNRFGFVIALLTGIMAYQVLENLRVIRAWKLGIALILSSSFFVGAVVYASPDAMWLAFLLPAVILLAFMAAEMRKVMLVGLLVLMESLAQMVMCAPGTLEASYTDMSLYLRASARTAGERAEITNNDIVNAPMLYGLEGVSAFNSVINPNTAGFLGKLGFASGENYYRFYGYTPVTAGWFGIRSIITNPQDQMPAPFVEKGALGRLQLWSHPLSLSWGVTGLDENALLTSANKFENINRLFPDAFVLHTVGSSVTTKAEITSQQPDAYSLKSLKAKEPVVITLDSWQAQDAYLYGRMNGADTFTVEKNDQEIARNHYEGNIVYLGSVGPEDKIRVIFQPDSDRETASVNVYAASASPEKTREILYDLQMRSLRNQKVSQNRIEGERFSPQEEKMVFTIPYDKGWKAYVNGTEVPVEAFHDAFVQVPLPAGDNHLVLVFIPQGLQTGLWITLAGLLAALLMLGIPAWRQRRKSVL